MEKEGYIDAVRNPNDNEDLMYSKKESDDDERLEWEETSSEEDETSSEEDFGLRDVEEEEELEEVRGKPPCWWEQSDEELLDRFFKHPDDDYPLDREKLKRETIPILRKYLQQVYESEGFEIIDYPCHPYVVTSIMPNYRTNSMESDDVYSNLAKKAMRKFNRKYGTAYEVEEVKSVNLELSQYNCYYMTFTASANGDEKTFQTKIWQLKLLGLGHNRPEVEFCRFSKLKNKEEGTGQDAPSMEQVRSLPEQVG